MTTRRKGARSVATSAALLAILLSACGGHKPAAQPATPTSSGPATTAAPAATGSPAEPGSPPPTSSGSAAKPRARSVQGNKDSNSPAISADGRYVAFTSEATNLVPNDTNRASDIFIRDRKTGTTSRVSVSSHGVQGNEDSYDPSISADGRYVAFVSWASNLVSGDTNHCIAVAADYRGCADVFVRDRLNGTTGRVSVSSSGAQGNERAENARISADGRYIAFSSWASTLVPGDTNECSEGGGVDEPAGCPDVFVRDLVTHRTERVSVASDGTQLPDGGYLPSISADGSVVTFLILNETRTRFHLAIRDRATGTTTNVPDPTGVDPMSGPFAAIVTADGKHVFFQQHDAIFRYDRSSGSSTDLGPRTTSGSRSQGTLYGIEITPEGRYVAFASTADDLRPGHGGQSDIFVLEVATGRVTVASVSSRGAYANGDVLWPAISPDASLVAFTSQATNLVPHDTNRAIDVFVRDRSSGTTTRVSVS